MESLNIIKKNKYIDRLKTFYKKYTRIYILPELMCLLMSVFNYLMIEMQFSGVILKGKLIYTILNILIIFIVFLLLQIFISKPKLALLIGNLFCLVYVISQFYIINFRGAPWQVSDLNIAILEGGLEVASGYSFSLYFDIILDILYSSLLALIISISSYKRLNMRRRIAVGAICAALLLIILPNLKPMLNKAVLNREVDFYSRNQPYKKMGHVLMFAMDGMSGGVEKPEDYTTEAVNNICENVKENSSSIIKNNIIEPNDKLNEDSPNIIGIMNESFADLSHINNNALKTNMDYIPYIRNLKDNTIKGYVTVSAYGGYSCNSEYEFLTGNTLGFLPVGTTTFTQYLKEPKISLVSYLNNYGYNTYALSGCESNVWGLENAYDMLQFENTMFYEDIEKTTDVEKNRGLITDRCMFRLIIDKFKNKDKFEKIFLWCTTMQNHGGYKNTNKSMVYVENEDISESLKNQVETYLGSIRKTDIAVKNLIEYFKEYDEKVVIVMFGDHFPHIDGLLNRLYGKNIDNLSIKDAMKMYQTPFLIWANYDISEEEIDEISLNYLSSLLMEVCGIAKNGYQKFLTALYEAVPIINCIGYSNGKDTFQIKDTNNYTDKMNQYRILQYNNMFDKPIDDFFQ